MATEKLFCNVRCNDNELASIGIFTLALPHYLHTVVGGFNEYPKIAVRPRTSGNAFHFLNKHLSPELCYDNANRRS